MRAGRANSNDGESVRHEVDEQEASPLVGLELLEAPQHIAGASEPSRCDVGLGLPRLPTALV